MTITEVSARLELTQDTLRYYERIGLIRSIKRNRAGIREYTEEDCNWIEFIKCMRSAGLPIEVLVEYVGLSVQGDATIQARKELLRQQRNQLAARVEEMQRTLKRLDHKIETYENSIVPLENRLKKQKRAT